VFAKLRKKEPIPSLDFLLVKCNAVGTEQKEKALLLYSYGSACNIIVTDIV